MSPSSNQNLDGLWCLMPRSIIFQQRFAGENYRPAASHRQTLSLTVVWSTPRHEQDYNSQWCCLNSNKKDKQTTYVPVF
jgi:hypothetical protein